MNDTPLRLQMFSWVANSALLYVIFKSFPGLGMDNAGVWDGGLMSGGAIIVIIFALGFFRLNRLLQLGLEKLRYADDMALLCILSIFINGMAFFAIAVYVPLMQAANGFSLLSGCLLLGMANFLISRIMLRLSGAVEPGMQEASAFNQ